MYVRLAGTPNSIGIYQNRIHGSYGGGGGEIWYRTYKSRHIYILPYIEYSKYSRHTSSTFLHTRTHMFQIDRIHFRRRQNMQAKG